MSYTDRYDNTIDFDLGGGPDSWETMRIRITAEGEQDASVEFPLAEAVKVLTAGAAEAADALAAQKPLRSPLADGGEVTHILHTVENISFHMHQDEKIVWETRQGWHIQWKPDLTRWQITRPGGHITLEQMGKWAPIIGAEHYPILGITVDVAPNVIHDGELHKLPQSPHYRYRTNRGATIEWDWQREKFIVKPKGYPNSKAEEWHPDRLLEGLPPNQFPIIRTS